MGQINARLRSTQGHHFSHWCPGCGEMHGIPKGWTFDGNYDAPTVTPSVKITGKQTVKDERGEWMGDWVRGADGKALDECCHYILTSGQLNFCGDCTHKLAGQTVPIPDLPAGLRGPLTPNADPEPTEALMQCAVRTHRAEARHCGADVGQTGLR